MSYDFDESKARGRTRARHAAHADGSVSERDGRRSSESLTRSTGEGDRFEGPSRGDASAGIPPYDSGSLDIPPLGRAGRSARPTASRTRKGRWDAADSAQSKRYTRRDGEGRGNGSAHFYDAFDFETEQTEIPSTASGSTLKMDFSALGVRRADDEGATGPARDMRAAAVSAAPEFTLPDSAFEPKSGDRSASSDAMWGFDAPAQADACVRAEAYARADARARAEARTQADAPVRAEARNQAGAPVRAEARTQADARMCGGEDFDIDAALQPSERYSHPNGDFPQPSEWETANAYGAEPARSASRGENGAAGSAGNAGAAYGASARNARGSAGGFASDAPGNNGTGLREHGSARPNSVRRDSAAQSSSASRPKPKKARSGRAGKIVLAVVAVIVILVGVCGFSLKSSIDKILDEKTNAVSAATAYVAGMKSGDAASIQTGSTGLQSSIDTICDELNGPIWSAASLLPVAGEEIRNARTMLNTAKTLVDEAAVPLGTYFAAHPLSSLVVGHGVDATELRNLVNQIQTAAPVITQAAATLSSLPTSRISQISSLQEKLVEPLSMVGELFQNNGAALSALPGMLGADGDRTYLLVAQTYAEVRSEGGFPGQLIEIRVSNGIIEIGQSEGIEDLCTYCFAEPVFSAGESAEAIAVFTESVDWHPGDFTMDPDFTHVGETYHRAWLGYKGIDVNGVITMDVPFLQMLVQAITDTIVLEDGSTLPSASISDELVHNTYVIYGNDGDAHEAHFNSVMDACISTVFGGFGSSNTVSFLKTVLEGMEDHRFMGWMTDANEQAALATLGMDGAVSTDPTTAELGVYYNNKTYGKIDWYLSRRNILHGSVKNADGSTTYTVSTILTNTCTWEEAATLPAYIVGANCRAPGDMTTDLVLYAPAGGTVSNVRMGGTEQPFGMNAQWVYGINAVYGTFSLAPGATLQVTYDVTTSAQAAEELELRQTPMNLNESMDFETDASIAPATNGIGL